MPTVYLNGAYMDLSEARVPVLDRGFIFGDGVYEVVPVYSRRPFRLDEHLSRLQHSLDSIRLTNPLTVDRWREHIHALIRQAPWEDQGIYLHVTRGPAPRDHAFPAHPEPTVFMMPMALPSPGPDVLAHGVAAVTAQDNRWLRGDIKATSQLANVLLRQLSVDAGCAETLLLRDGQLTEGSASNIFAVIQGELTTPPKSHLILPGITYDVVLELATSLDTPVRIRHVSEAELRLADELWLTSSTKEITPVTRLDGRPVGDGRPGPVFRAFHTAYQEYKRRAMRGLEGNTSEHTP